MTRQTSIEVYHQIRDEGLLGELQFAVYQILFDHGPLTQGETFELLHRNVDKVCITPRFAELEKMGAVYSCGRRTCRRSGRVCLIWDVTTKLPVIPPKRKTKDQIIMELQDRIRQLEAEIGKLRVPQATVIWEGNQARLI